MPNIIATGAEAIISRKKHKGSDIILKHRVKKSYRLSVLDEKIKRQRTRREARVLEKAGKIIPVPGVISVNEKTNELRLGFIGGKKLSDHLERLDFRRMSKAIGENIAKLHEAGIIHGDLTTSNMIYNKAEDRLYFIDFGLSFHSERAEDKAVDLHLIKEALEAKHPGIFEESFKIVIASYKRLSKNSPEVLKRLEKVEKRGRYKAQF